jgi:limonene-1,2-epoxide hydrolase
MTTAQASTQNAVQTAAAEVVTDFLFALQADDLERVLSLLTDDAEWINVSLPTVRGRRSIERILRTAQKAGGGFRVHFHAIASEGDVVLTQRTDAMTLGRFEQRFWVAGRFEVRDGKIAVWRDSFDWGDLLVGLVRAVAGLISPRLNRPWPVD